MQLMVLWSWRYMLSSFWTALALLKANAPAFTGIAESMNAWTASFSSFWRLLINTGVSWRTSIQEWSAINPIIVPIAIVALYMRLFVCKYGIERQACAYQIVLVILQPLSLLWCLFLSLGLMVTLFLFQSLLMLVRCLHVFSNCGSLHAVSQGESYHRVISLYLGAGIVPCPGGATHDLWPYNMCPVTTR